MAQFMQNVLFYQKKVYEINSILWKREEQLCSISLKKEEISLLPKYTSFCITAILFSHIAKKNLWKLHVS
jgi:hypothetical protein